MAFLLLRYQLANQTKRWSLRNSFDNFRRRTRTLIDQFFRRSELVKDTNFSLPKFPNSTKPAQSSFQNVFRRAAKWPRDTLVSRIWRTSGNRLFGGATGATVSLMGFTLANKSSILTEMDELEELSYEIRAAFTKIPPEIFFPSDLHCCTASTIDELEIGDILAKGSNAAIYSARWRRKQDEKDASNLNEECAFHANNSQSTVVQDHAPIQSKIQLGSLLPFDLAVKLMFNYSAKSDAATIWKAMVKEALPAIQGLPYKSVAGLKSRQIPPHPNVVEMHCAFADEMPLLSNAMSSYPQALPLRLTKQGYGRNMTLFLVMKRYHCSLSEYLQEHQPSPYTSLSLFTQLLEGLTHLRQHQFAHRDLKTNNILLDLSQGVSTPSVAITDFGCCLDRLELPFPSDELDRGGNTALMAPEVATAQAGLFSTIDYSRSDLWTLGTMTYEIFGGVNPFYMSNGTSLESINYLESELPELPFNVPPVVKRLIKDMLHRDPALRPSASFAATVCQLLLHAPPDLLTSATDNEGSKKILNWLLVLAAEIYLKASMQTPKPQDVQFQLQYTFCRRMQFSEVINAIRYIAE